MKGMIIVHDIDDEIEIDGYGYWEILHDTVIYVYHRAMITVDRPIDSYLYRGSFLELIGSWFIGQLIEISDLRVWH